MMNLFLSYIVDSDVLRITSIKEWSYWAPQELVREYLIVGKETHSFKLS